MFPFDVAEANKVGLNGDHVTYEEYSFWLSNYKIDYPFNRLKSFIDPSIEVVKNRFLWNGENYTLNTNPECPS